MKVLFILPYQVVPPNSGNKNLTANILQFMTRKISCDLVMLIDAGESSVAAVKCLRQAYPLLQHVEAFEKPQGWTRILERVKAISYGYHPSLGSHMSDTLRTWLRTNSKHYDLIHFDMFHMSLYRDLCRETPCLLVASDAYSMAARGGLKLSNSWASRAKMLLEGWWFFSNVERWQYRKFDIVCCVAERDATYLNRQVKGLDVKTVGIGLGNEYSQRRIQHFDKAFAQKTEILITGSLDHEGVAMGAAHFIRACLPVLMNKYPNLNVTLLGKNPHTLLRELITSYPNLRHIEFVQHYADFLDQDWVYVYPQQCGTGLQTKVQQAMALGLPVVGYPVSFGGLNVSTGYHCYICQDAEEIAQRVSILLSDPLHRITMGKVASAHIRSFFSIERIGLEMMNMYRLAIESFHQR